MPENETLICSLKDVHSSIRSVQYHTTAVRFLHFAWHSSCACSAVCCDKVSTVYYYKSLRTPKPAGFGGSVSVVNPDAGSAVNLPLLKQQKWPTQQMSGSTLYVRYKNYVHTEFYYEDIYSLLNTKILHYSQPCDIQIFL